ncbi:hypothetical protein JYU34_014351 [Plutella xylostella]|uniref:Gamma-tubulin complex component n=1 Tax=Plutella xylostella TaxID=51655 RepID=A0ABQ7Q842_PLUXY|nr:hypothetical protein JYU34_014351 [Plutella xylostella]
MIHDALLVLWDCSQATRKDPVVGPFANDGDSEMYGRICEIARSHHKIQNFVEATSFHARKSYSRPRNHGMYAQALSEGITEVLQSYKKTLLEVEGLIIGNHKYTLSFVYSYVEKYRGLFNTLSRIISTIKERRLVGCQILSLTHQHILNGNEMVHEAIVKIFANINKVFVNQLCSWLLYGEFKDPYGEFFICASEKEEEASDTFLSSPTTDHDKSLVVTLQDTALDCGYNLKTNMIPYFVPLSLAQEILFIGKTVILFGFDPSKLKRHSSAPGPSSSMVSLQPFGSSDARRFTIWEENEAEFHEKLQSLKNPQEFEVCNLRNVVREIKECVTKHLWTVAVEEAQLMHELQLMKDFFLLGRGELFQELLRLSSHILDNPVTRTSTRDMNHAFQLAARAVYLGNNPDIEKFSFELPYVKPNVSNNSSIGDDSSSASDGWSCIVLKYQLKWPLQLIFTPEVLARYNDMFRLLLRVKHTQRDLHRLWKTCKQSNSFEMCQLHNKLTFLVDNLQHYLQADVLESNYSRLLRAARGTGDFDQLRLRHHQFLHHVLSQSFLIASMPSSSDSDAGDVTQSPSSPVPRCVLELLQLCRSYCREHEARADTPAQSYCRRGRAGRYNVLVKQLMELLVSLRSSESGVFLSRLLMRLDYNRWLSGEARLTHSVTNMLR